MMVNVLLAAIPTPALFPSIKELSKLFGYRTKIFLSTVPIEDCDFKVKVTDLEFYDKDSYWYCGQ